jgi:hypothetical protein
MLNTTDPGTCSFEPTFCFSTLQTELQFQPSTLMSDISTSTPGLLPVTQAIAANRYTTPAICLLVRFLTENVTKTHQKKQNKKPNNKK